MILLKNLKINFWVAKLKNKTDSDKAIENVLRESYIRSRNKLRVLRTDGDGIFGRKVISGAQRERNLYMNAPMIINKVR